MSNTKWKLVAMPEDMQREGWTEGTVYAVSLRGKLLDDDGCIRLSPAQYNRYYGYDVFKSIPKQMENK